MKKMNYEAPKAEVIELNVNKEFMQGPGVNPPSGGGTGGGTTGIGQESGTWS